MRIQILDPAKQDLIDGYYFYETQAEGVGRYFLDSLYSDIDSLKLYAGIHPKKFGNFHWMLSKRFPYAIHYDLDTDSEVVSVHAVLDCRQEPEQIKKRIQKEQEDPGD